MFLVGKVTDEKHKAFEIAGVFSTEQKAVAQCISDMYFLGEVILDKEYPKETCQFEYAYFPMLQSAPKRKIK